MGILFGFAAAVAGCGLGSDGATSPGPDGGTPDAGPPAAILRVQGEPALGLLFGERAAVTVLYTEADGEPIANAEVGFAFEGRANDSTLAQLRATTDETGQATGEVLAGMTPAAFRLRITAERAAPAYVDVSVGDAGFGALRAEIAYDGMREADHRHVALFADARCTDMVVAGGSADRLQVLPPDGTEGRFLGLPAELSYAVLARAEGPTGVVLAEGCADGIVVIADDEVRVVVTMADRALAPEGTYLMETRIESVGSATALGEAVRTAGAATLTAAGGDAAFLLDTVEAALRDRGEDADADALGVQRATGDLDALVSARLGESTTGPSLAVEDLATTFEARLGKVVIASEVVLSGGAGAFESSWTTLAIAAEAPDPDFFALALDLSRVGVEPDGTIEVTPRPADDALTVDRLAVTLPLGSLGRAALLALADERASGSPGVLLLDRSGCRTLADVIAEETMIGASCDRSCVLDVCTMAMEGLAESIALALGALDVEWSTIVLTGDLDQIDTSGDLLPDSLIGAGLAGRWGDPSGTTGEPITGSADALRAETLP